MDQADLKPLLKDLSSDIDSLSTSLKPLLDNPLPTTASKLPLLDKSKLHVLTTYTIESLLFSSLRLSGVDPKEHPIFRELARTRQYFEKIKTSEEGTQKRTLEVDKAAAGRIIKAGLAGNDELDRQRVAEQTRQKASAKRKHDTLSGQSEEYGVGRAAELAKKTKRQAADGTAVDAEDTESNEAEPPSQTSSTRGTDDSPTGKATKKQKKSKRQRGKSSKPPKSGHEAFQSLMQGPRDHG